jgi:membrane peptidoglycan carboxypeptidase
MKKVYLTKKKKPVTKTKSRTEIAKENRLKKLNDHPKLKVKNLKKKLGKIALIFVGLLFIASALGGLGVMAYLQSRNDQIPSPDKVFPTLPVATEIFDRKAYFEGEASGTRLYRVIGDYNSDEFTIEEIPDHVKLAFLAAEDSDFFDHNGFDPIAILRCGINYIKDRNSLCGGSTITQQLVKLTTERAETTVGRKIDELLTAVKVEQSYDKDKILEMYLKAAPFGSSIVGLKTASEFYFGKEPKDLSLMEASILAAIIQNPIQLSPTLPVGIDTQTAQELVAGRASYILDQLQEKKGKFNNDLRKFYNDPNKADVITDELLTIARGEDWKAALRPPIVTDKKAGHFVDYVMDLLTKKNYKNGAEPFTTNELQTGGYRIYTTLDYGIQETAERYVLSGGNDYKFANVHNSSLLLTTPSNGQIIAMSGSKSYYGEKEGCDSDGINCQFDGQVNIMTSLQEPGSSNKPLGYMEAFRQGKIFTESLLPDVPIRIVAPGGSGYEPKNWDSGFKGVNYTASQALKDSRNIPAIFVVESIGVDRYVQVAQEFGYTSFTDSYGQSVILGGVSVYGVEHAQAYGVYANGGDLVELNPILKIVDRNGNTVYEATPTRKQVGDPQAIYLLNQVIKNYDNYSPDGRDVAGKTGTTENNRDAWYVGYSPDFVLTCWSGNNNNDPLSGNSGWPSIVVHPWCKPFLAEVSNSQYLSYRTPFQRPGGIIESGGDCNDQGECQGISRGYMIEGRVPPRTIKQAKATVCEDQQDKIARPIDVQMGKSIEKNFIKYTSIVPDWQKFIDEFVQKAGYLNNIPTEPCNIDRTGGAVGPFVSSLNGNFSGNNLHVTGSAFSTDGVTISKINIFLNNQQLNSCTITSNFSNFDVTCPLSNGYTSGNPYPLRAEIVDVQNRTNIKQVDISFSHGFSLVFPASLEQGNLKYGTQVGCGGSCNSTITVNAPTAASVGINQVTVSEVKNGSLTGVAKTVNLSNGSGTFTWGNILTPPAPNSTDTYQFIVTGSKSGWSLTSEPLGNIKVVP